MKIIKKIYRGKFQGKKYKIEVFVLSNIRQREKIRVEK